MVKCSEKKCAYEHCCIECDAQKSQGYQCGCEVAADLCHEKSEILERCECASESDKL